jgi:hypothetical protein
MCKIVIISELIIHIIQISFINKYFFCIFAPNLQYY